MQAASRLIFQGGSGRDCGPELVKTFPSLTLDALASTMAQGGYAAQDTSRVDNCRSWMTAFDPGCVKTFVSVATTKNRAENRASMQNPTSQTSRSISDFTHKRALQFLVGFFTQPGPIAAGQTRQSLAISGQSQQVQTRPRASLRLQIFALVGGRVYRANITHSQCHIYRISYRRSLRTCDRLTRHRKAVTVRRE